MKDTLNMMLCAGALATGVGLAAPLWAEDAAPSYEALSERWLLERDEAVDKLSDAWLADPANPKLKSMLLRVITLEVRLSTREDVKLYTADIGPNRSLDEAIRKVSLAHLQTRGWNPRTADLLEGRQFFVEPTTETAIAAQSEDAGKSQPAANDASNE